MTLLLQLQEPFFFFFFWTKGGGGRGCIALDDDFWTLIYKKIFY